MFEPGAVNPGAEKPTDGIARAVVLRFGVPPLKDPREFPMTLGETEKPGQIQNPNDSWDIAGLFSLPAPDVADESSAGWDRGQHVQLHPRRLPLERRRVQAVHRPRDHPRRLAIGETVILMTSPAYPY